MNGHLKAVQRIDKITDCIPVVSTIKNVSIVLYQLAHKVDKTANPVTNTIRDDIKIVALSKSAKCALFFSIPIFGNCAAFVWHGIRSVLGHRSEKNTEYYEIQKIEKGFSRGEFSHSLEIAKLYNARQKMDHFSKDYFAFEALITYNEDVFKFLFDSNDWSENNEKVKFDISSFYFNTRNQSIKEYLIKHKRFDKEAAENCFRHHKSKLTPKVISQLKTRFPEIDLESIENGKEEDKPYITYFPYVVPPGL